ncbi:hypothetical protein MF672_023695 [Actinomadura sp. ATCC 31491]|uniref:Uncharacterized protein n=1 Tax=Actinomadura luzonensis TaxID=2805427 RepID=A0ABT0FY19_9ACTN|nr:hypothetical protein [Actinomadura luzonensis]MCK2216781.1 hypothetical protein [Actinomadura luzonensis]
MIDESYSRWFRRYTTNVLALTWCSATTADDVLAAYGISPKLTEPMHFLGGDIDMLIGRLGNGTVIMDYCVDYPTLGALPALAQHGPCLSAAWCGDVPAIVSYYTQGGRVVEFDARSRDWYSDPDLASVEQWIATTPAGKEIWDDRWIRAVLVTAEGMLQAAIDEEWMRSTHVGVTFPE